MHELDLVFNWTRKLPASHPLNTGTNAEGEGDSLMRLQATSPHKDDLWRWKKDVPEPARIRPSVVDLESSFATLRHLLGYADLV